MIETLIRKDVVRESFDFISKNEKIFASLVNNQFEKQKEKLRKEMIVAIQACFTPLPPHYNIIKIPDAFGVITLHEENGLVRPDQPISNALTEEDYSGTLYSEQIATLEIGIKIVKKVLFDYIKEHLSYELTNDEQDFVLGDLVDIVLNRTFLSDFFYPATAVDILNLSNLSLRDILEMDTTSTDFP